MSPLHARYPFFEAAREAVEASGVALSALVAEDAPAVARGRERVERALLSGTTAPDDPGEWSLRDELLSYPVARILVSLVDSRAAVRKYAAAEAATAHERFVADFEAGDDGLRSTDRRTASIDDCLREFDLAADVRTEPPEHGREPDAFRIALGAYLRLSDPGWGDEWRLVNREVAAGAVRVRREELYRLLRKAVRRRVAEGLPFDVRASAEGERIADALEPEVEALRELLADRQGAWRIDTVAPELFPPCMKRLLERARREADLEPHSAFSLTAFLTGIGMDTDEIIDLYRDTPLDEEAIRYQTEYLRDEAGAQYPPPSCATMRAYDDCVNPDARCETISHPMGYYEAALSDAGEVTDWRDRESEVES
ncbi:DNA primase large subunit PriL [Halegenticoccus tardaugens]|uniref:DNA primase large subunit PriL n=1 Tax=Halegenticoccus tardaugens TaxID=2071624 RepID=UPI00100BB5DF|nr:DNA primase large subunit PriL [Halegenticoccus tardaugens]